jgi:hypothetical protein
VATAAGVRRDRRQHPIQGAPPLSGSWKQQSMDHHPRVATLEPAWSRRSARRPRKPHRGHPPRRTRRSRASDEH